MPMIQLYYVLHHLNHNIFGGYHLSSNPEVQEKCHFIISDDSLGWMS